MNRAEAVAALGDIVTTGEIASRVGVSQAAVGNWTMRHWSFPRSLGYVGKAAVYFWPEVEAWYHRGDSRVG